MAKEKEKVMKETKKQLEMKDIEMSELEEEKAKIKKELEDMKQDFQMKVNTVKLMEIELEEKLAEL